MRKYLKVSRAVQLIGALCWIYAITIGVGAMNGADNGGVMGPALAIGLFLIVGAKVFEFFVKE